MLSFSVSGCDVHFRKCRHMKTCACYVIRNWTAEPKVVQFSQKGADVINVSSRRSDVVETAGISVHVLCRKIFFGKKDEIKKRQTATRALARKCSYSWTCSSQYYSLLILRYLCGLFFQTQTKIKAFQIITDDFAETIKRYCDMRCAEWSFKVKGRLEYYLNDLHAAECVYHHTWSVKLRSGKHIPHASNPKTMMRRKGDQLMTSSTKHSFTPVIT